MNKLVSIIVPAYNAEKYIKECVESIINQTYKNIEIIIVNDGSTDNTLNVLKKCNYDNRLKVITTENHGVSSARNTAIKNCKGDFIMFVDSDDWIEPKAVETLLEALTKSESDIVQASYFSDKDKPMKLIERNVKKEDIPKLREKIFSVNTINNENFGALRCVWGKIFKRKVIENIKFYENIYLLEDGIFLYECMENIENFQFISQCLYHYRTIETSACNRFNKDQLTQYENISNVLLNILKKEQKQIYYKVMLECIMTYISRVMSYSKIEKKEKIKLIYNLIREIKYQETILNIDERMLSSKEKITLYLLKNERIQVLYIICKIKDFVKGKI